MLEDIMKEIIKFRDERGWKETDTVESLAKSIFVESGELLENFQWGESSYDESNVKDELADVILYSLALAHDLGFDVRTITKDKLKKNAQKYPLK